MTTKHSPGKWIVTEGRVVCTKRDLYLPQISVCNVLDNKEGEPRGPSVREADANARLIAQAPRLLEALNWITEFIAEHPEWDAESFRQRGEAASETEWFDAACKIIDEAEGKGRKWLSSP